MLENTLAEMTDESTQKPVDQVKMATYRVSTGRGGAGNVQSTSSKVSPKLIPQGSQTPNILQPVFSTGRGGAGNMRRNVDAKLTRKAQDVDEETDDDIIGPAQEEDYIEPFSGDDVTKALSGGALSCGSGSRETGKSHLRSTRSKRNSLDEKPMTIAVGRGGAGNIISPKASRSQPKKKKTATSEPSKKGLWASVKSFFS